MNIKEYIFVIIHDIISHYVIYVRLESSKDHNKLYEENEMINEIVQSIYKYNDYYVSYKMLL